MSEKVIEVLTEKIMNLENQLKQEKQHTYDLECEIVRLNQINQNGDKL